MKVNWGGGGGGEYIWYKMKGYSIHRYQTFNICREIRHRQYMNSAASLQPSMGYIMEAANWQPKAC